MESLFDALEDLGGNNSNSNFNTNANNTNNNKKCVNLSDISMMGKQKQVVLFLDKVRETQYRMMQGGDG